MTTLKTKSSLGFIWAAVFFLLLGIFTSANAATFAGTTWVSVNGGSTIVFAADGTWTENWRGKPSKGTWQAKGAREVTVTRDDGMVFHFRLNPEKNLVRDRGRLVYEPASSTKPASATASSPPPPPPEHTAPTVKLTDDQARAVVLIKGDNAEGTGFLVKTADGPVVVTNIHVISNNPNLNITTNTGVPITILSYKGATDRDLAMIAIKDGDFKYLDLATDVSGTVQPGDEVITPGNSEGGEVMLNTDGKVLGIGPDRIEFDNPIYHGNSGGPIFHVKSGKVIGVATEAIQVDTSNALDKASFANRNSAIGHSMRYFGFRLDNVPKWEAYDWGAFQKETAFLEQFDKRSRCLDCFVNAPDDNKPEDIVWREDDKIVKANNDCFDQRAGADTAQQIDAVRELWQEMSDLADSDMDQIQNPANFYSFDQQRAKDEADYRKALKTELNKINDDVTRLGSLPRTNN